jgi:hypothetical protein
MYAPKRHTESHPTAPPAGERLTNLWSLALEPAREDLSELDQ